MTKIEALKKSLKMWRHLQQHPKHSKINYLAETLGNDDICPENFCYLCEYTINNKEDRLVDCKKCPAQWKDISGNIIEPENFPCESTDSPYALWAWTDIQYTDELEQRSRYADQVADLIEEALNKELKKEK